MLLKEEYAIDAPDRFMAFVEGSSDLAYLKRAAELAIQEGSADPLRVPAGVASHPGDRIALFAPGRPGAPHRGGTAQLVRLAGDLKPYVFTLEAFGGVIFLLDGDQEGSRARDQILSLGYPEPSVLRLIKADHPRACADRGLVIEDLLSLDVQRRFFEESSPWCDAVYEAGQLVRFKWGYNSKMSLCKYVLNKANAGDLHEVSNVLIRFRRTFGFG